MKIAQIAPLWLEVPPQAYGGTEYVISLLTEELVRRGHEVTLFSTANTKTNAKLVPIWPKGLFKDGSVKDTSAVFGMLFDEIFKRSREFDIIHDHTDTLFTPISNIFSAPVVSTIHGLITEEKTMLYKRFPNVNYVAISQSQKRFCPGVNVVKAIHHGIPVEKYSFNKNPEDYLLWISNIAPDKGLAQAIEIAKITNEKLIISGPIFPPNADFFEYRIKPMIDNKQIQFVGESNFEKKIELFKNAKALLFPVFSRHEPFGLVVIESLACGTPVIAPKLGSLPELIEDKKTGFIANSVEEAASAVRRIGEISRQACRDSVKKKFTLKRMVNSYERLYKNILEKQQTPGWRAAREFGIRFKK